jgi:hypothetical protein
MVRALQRRAAHATASRLRSVCGAVAPVVAAVRGDHATAGAGGGGGPGSIPGGDDGGVGTSRNPETVGPDGSVDTPTPSDAASGVDTWTAPDVGTPVEAGSPGPVDITFSIHANHGARPISPYVYGVNDGDQAGRTTCPSCATAETGSPRSTGRTTPRTRAATTCSRTTTSCAAAPDATGPARS